jgi:hypothetical protein
MKATESNGRAGKHDVGAGTDRHDAEGGRRPPSRRGVVLEVVAAVVAASVAVVLYMIRPAGLLRLASVEFEPDPGVAARRLAGHADSVWWSTACWVLGAVALALVCHVGCRVFVSPVWGRLTHGALVGAVTAAVLAVLGALLLAHYPESWTSGQVWVIRAAQAMAFARNCLLAVVLPVAVGVLVVTAVRLHRARRSAGSSWTRGEDVIPRRRDGLRPATGDPQHAVAAPGAGDPPGNGSKRTPADDKVDRSVHEELWLPSGRKLHGKGICVSGGGIRSACVALGALQALQREKELKEADYLVSVSGGGYTVGAYQMALTGEPPDLARTEATPADVLEAGSPEEDHLRRHSSYVADSAADWAAAFGTLLRGVLANLALLSGTVIAVGGMLYVFYRYTPVITLSDLAPGRGLPDIPGVPGGVLTALVTALVLAVLMFSVGLAAFATNASRGHRVNSVGRAFATLTVVLAVFGVLLPLLLWATGRATLSLNLSNRSGLTPAGIGTILLTYLGAIVGIIWRSRDLLGRQVSGLRARLTGLANRADVRGVAGGLTQRVVVAVALLVLASAFLLLLGWAATNAPQWSWSTWGLLAAGLVFVSVVLDQTWLGLHPFYRRRLATAFAMRRVRKQGLLRAEPYDYEREVTRLSEYGGKRDGFPQVIFAATANLSGSELTPPGRRAVSYTFSHDWIGGPQVGWVRTASVDGTEEDRSFGHVSRDVTVQAAVAVSGAAFASAMGSQARAYQTFFALSNARLGTWLPNPGHIAAHLANRGEPDWSAPRLPRLRRLQYLLREIVGSYPDTNPLLFITDGGHYENLGLVELLRHRCTAIYCIDASGDCPPLASTLGQAITLAYEELGVRIELHDPFHLVAGGGESLEPREPLSSLSGRLSAAAVLTGTIHYPPRGKLRAKEGTLVVAKASLTPRMPYEVLSYAQSNPVFPNDSTADQWFNVGQFDAYQAVGWHIGMDAVVAMRAAQAQPQSAAEAAAASAPAPQSAPVNGWPRIGVGTENLLAGPPEPTADRSRTWWSRLRCAWANSSSGRRPLVGRTGRAGLRRVASSTHDHPDPAGPPGQLGHPVSSSTAAPERGSPSAS